jgi:bis(5'-nucleosyl)-tetraphosphatase (symmetrical)
MGDAAIVTLGNHDLHLLAVVHGAARLRNGDTLDEILQAPDRDELLAWLISRPLMHFDRQRKLALLHAGLPPQWDMSTAEACAREFERALQSRPEALFAHMYGDKPDFWSADLDGMDRLRFIVNSFTRLRYLDEHGRLALRTKGSPAKMASKQLVPWYAAEHARWRGPRIIFGHWSTLGFHQDRDVIGLDTGCVWGGALTALRLDQADAKPVSITCGSARAG